MLSHTVALRNFADGGRLGAAAGGAQENHDLVRAFGAPADGRGARRSVKGVARPCSAVGCEKRWQFRMNVEWRCPLRSWLLAGAVALASCAPEQDAASGSATNEARPARAPAEPTADKGISPDSQTPAAIAPPTPAGWGPLPVGMHMVAIVAA